jgi:glucose/arabinose dehydrogenase
VTPEEVDLVLQDRHYGWPYCYGQRVWDADFGRRGPDFCAITELPAVEMQAHSAPLGLAFYTGRQFPPAYQGNLFVAFHGSWNRTVPTGYKLVRLPFSGRGRPTGEVIDFATGWLVGDKSWGRPVDVVVGPDGSLFVSDDRYGAVYRIYYAGPNVG